MSHLYIQTWCHYSLGTQTKLKHFNAYSGLVCVFVKSVYRTDGGLVRLGQGEVNGVTLWVISTWLLLTMAVEINTLVGTR